MDFFKNRNLKKKVLIFTPDYKNGGAENFDVLMTYHWAQQCNKDLWTGQQGRYGRPGADWSDEFHTYGVEWVAGESIEWFVDGIRRYSVHTGWPASSLTVPFDPFYMILNTALQPWASSKLDAGLPCTHVIDRVTWCVPEKPAVGERALS